MGGRLRDIKDLIILASKEEIGIATSESIAPVISPLQISPLQIFLIQS